MRAEQTEILQQVAACQDLEAFEASDLDLNVVVRTMLDEPGQPRKSSKNVVKAFAKALQATRQADGVQVSCYSQAVEMFAYAAACAPLLEPDQLVRVIDLAPQTFKAYSPEGLLQAAEGLTKVLSPYSPQRRERLAKDLWVHAHRNEWWVDRTISSLPELSGDNWEMLDALRRLELRPDLYGLPDAQFAGFLTDRTKELLARPGGVFTPPEPGWNSDMVAYVSCVEAGGTPHGSLSTEQVDVVLRSPLAKCLDVRTLVHLVRGRLYGAEALARYSDLFDADTHLVPEVAALVRGSQEGVVLASHLVSPERFQAAYRQAGLAMKTSLQASPYLTAEQASEYGVSLIEAMERLECGIRPMAVETLAKYQPHFPEQLAQSVGRFMAAFDEVSLKADHYFAGTSLKRLLDKPLSHFLEDDLESTVPFRQRWDLNFDASHQAFFRANSRWVDVTLDDFKPGEVAKGDQVPALVCQMDTEFAEGLKTLIHEFDPREVEAAANSWGSRPVRWETLEALAEYSPLQQSKHGRVFGLSIGSLSELMLKTRGTEASEKTWAPDLSDPHVQARIAQGYKVGPKARPSSPIVILVRRACAPVDAGQRDLFPESPTRWGQLSNKVDSVPYQYPDAIADLDGSPLSGVETTLVLVRSSAALKANSEHMGNCTSGYAEQAQDGQWAVFHFWVDGVEYNASIDIRNGRYSVGEVNTRFNKGGVSPEVEKAFEELVAGLNT